MKNSYYFPHDYHARHDPKLERLRMDIGPVGDGIYWDLVEMLYEEDGYLPLKDIPLIAKTLNTTKELVEKVINQSNLFIKQGDTFTSQSLLNRLKHISGKRWKAKVSANIRWNAEAMRMHSEGNAIKYSKESKESKLSELLLTLIKNRKPDFKKPNLEQWAEAINLMIRIDHREPARIKEVMEWCQRDEFWQNNILSTYKLRKQFDQLELKMQQKIPKPPEGAAGRPLD